MGGNQQPPKLYGGPLSAFLGTDEPDADDSADWDIRGVIPTSAPSVVAGKPKSSKTMLLENAAVAATAGMPSWCGCDIRRRLRVLFLPKEDTERQTRIRFHQLARGLGVDTRELDGWLQVDCTTPFRFDQKSDVAMMKRTLEKFRADVVVLDSLRRMHSGDENSSKDIAAVTAAWADIIHHTGAAVVSIHHYGKSGQGGAGQQLRGSSDLFAFARHVVGIERSGNRLTISAEGNMAYELEPFQVERVVEQLPNGRMSVRFDRCGTVDEVKATERIDQAENRIIAMLVDQGGSLPSKREVARLCKMKKETCDHAIDGLAQRGVLSVLPTNAVRLTRAGVVPVPVLRDGENGNH